MNTPAPPPAPDPVATAQAQGTINKDTAISQAQLNMVNQNGPGGSSSYNQIGTYADGTPRFEQNVSLSPSAQSLYDSQNGIQQSALNLGQGAIGKVQNAIDKPFDVSGLPGQVYGVTPGRLQTSIGDTGEYQSNIPGQQYQTSLPNTDYSANVKSVQDALMSRLAPQIEQDRTRRETRLANQGITAGSAAYDRATNLGEQAVTDQRTQALLAASGEQSRLAGLDLQAGNFANNAKGQQFQTDLARGTFGNSVISQQIQDALAKAGFANSAQAQEFAQGVTNANMNNAGRASGVQEAAYMRAQPINELASLMGFSPGVQVPNFQNTAATGIAPADYQGAVAQNYAGQMEAYKQKMQAQSALLGDIFGGASKVGSAAIFASERRLKKNITQIGTMQNGLPLYSFEYKSGGPVQIGFMVDEVEKVKPWAIVVRDGIKHVNYSLAAG